MAAGRLACLAAALAAAALHLGLVVSGPEAKLLLSALVHAKPNTPSPPTVRQCFATCPGPASDPCGSTECKASMQPGWQCFKTGAKVGCLMNRTSTLNCTSVKLPSGAWGRSCCDAGYTRCGGGCCQPRDGAPCACGKRWNGQEACCMSRLANQAKQAAARCCIVGVGVNCVSAGQLEPCCLDSVSARDPDPHVPCQPFNCSAFKKCYFGIGYDCVGRAKHPESIGKNRCCLNKGGPYPHDTCRPTPAACNESDYVPCKETGVDCSSQHGEACCLDQLGDQGACRRGSCDEYRREQDEKRKEEEAESRAFQTKVYWILGVMVVILLALVARPCFNCARDARELAGRCWTHFWGTAQSEEVGRLRQDSEVLLDATLEAAHGASQSTAALRADTEVLLDTTLESAHATSESTAAIRQDTHVLLAAAHDASQDTEFLVAAAYGASHTMAAIHADTGLVLGATLETSQLTAAIRVDTGKLLAEAHGASQTMAAVRAGTELVLDAALETAHATSQSTAAIREDTQVLLREAHGTSQSMAALQKVTARVQKSIELYIQDGHRLLLADGSQLPLRPALRFQTRVVYTIGCTEYRAGLKRLGNGNRSAEEVGQALQRVGFLCVQKADATKADMEAGLKEVMQQYIQGHEPALLVIYYSGHGIEGDNGLCWLGTDATLQDPKTHFSVRDMHSRIVEAGIRPSFAKEHFSCEKAFGDLHVLILADNCRVPGTALPKLYNGPSCATDRGKLLRPPARPSFLTIFATGAGQKARDGDDDLASPFARAFCEALKEYPNLTIHRFFEDVRLRVDKLTRGAQRSVQLLEDDMRWDVCLGPVDGSNPASASTSAADSVAATASTPPISSAAASSADAASFSSGLA